MIFFLLGCRSFVPSTDDQASAQDPNAPKLTFITVSVEGDLGSSSEPLPFSAEPISRNITVQTLDQNAEPLAFDGDLKLNVRNGRLASDMDPWISVTNGQWDSESANEPIYFQAAFGPSRIWVSDEGDKDSTSERKATYASGVSETMHFAFPTIAEFNRIEDTETNHLVGEFTEVRVSDRDVAVTVVGTNGFWITDLNDGVGNYASMYIYTFSKPSGVRPGYRITKLNGGNQEYLGTTQLSFPDHEQEEDNLFVEVPDMDEQTLCDPQKMEGYESAMVRVTNAQIPASFTPGSEEFIDYLEYGQWPAKLGDCSFHVDSNALSFAFDPVAYAGESFDAKGMITQIWSKWIIVLVDDDGISIDGNDFPTRPNHTGPQRPQPRHRE
ncbi:MAG: hypothetical protein VX278_10955 [Myxococcota bacterium]|nr:hypothetical protein [Myxococcota bacterium]